MKSYKHLLNKALSTSRCVTHNAFFIQFDIESVFINMVSVHIEEHRNQNVEGRLVWRK